MPSVLIESADRICTITLDRPEARNALNTALMVELASALAEADADGSVDVIVLTGSDPAFCAGLDLREMAETGRNLDVENPERSPFAVIRTVAKPLIGAINGPAITGGLELALWCDVLIASERARFGDTHAAVGAMPGGGLTVRLPQAVGLRKAKEMSLSANFIDADEALRIGLVNRVVSHADVVPAARALAGDIAANDQQVVRNLKRTYDQAAEGTPAEGLLLESREFRAWTVDRDELARRRTDITGRGHAQI